MSRAERLAEGIYWDRSWNPFTGCTPFPEGSTGVREGCRNCWAKRMAARLRGRCGYPADEPFRPTFHLDRLNQVNSRQKPQVIALCFMSDPFHGEHELGDIYQMIDKVIECSQHTFIALTKRPEDMRDILDCQGTTIPNLVGGISAWDQPSLDRMAPILLETNLATRIVSLEPTLGEVFLGQSGSVELYRPGYKQGEPVDLIRDPNFPQLRGRGLIDGLIMGGESGPRARPMHPGWARSVRDQCQAAGVPFFFKQWGEWIPASHVSMGNMRIPSNTIERCRNSQDHQYRFPDGTKMLRIGKKAAGRLLDGLEWNLLPEIINEK